MKIGQYRQRRRCKHVELEKFLQTFASRGFVSDSWAFLFILVGIYPSYVLVLRPYCSLLPVGHLCCVVFWQSESLVVNVLSKNG